VRNSSSSSAWEEEAKQLDQWNEFLCEDNEEGVECKIKANNSSDTKEISHSGYT
jgi:hypothetical protein